MKVTDEGGTGAAGADPALEQAPQQPTAIDLAEALLAQMADPSFSGNDLKALIDRMASTPPGIEAFDAVATGIRGYVGYDAGTYILDWLTSTTPETLEQELEDMELGPGDRDRLRGLLRSIRGIYGPAITPLFAMWQERPDDWRRASRYIYWDKIAEKWLIRVELEKYSGELAVFEGSAASVANIIRFLLATLNILDDRAAVDTKTLDLLSDELDTFRTTYLESTPETSAVTT